VIVVAFLVASMILCKIWRILLLGWVDRIGGAIFGLVRGILLIGLLSILLSLFPIKQTEELIKGSFLLQFFEPFKTFILSLFPFSESFMR
jgi:membrane protein required for colicin V production